MQLHPGVFAAFPEQQVVCFGEDDHAQKRKGILHGWRGEEIGREGRGRETNFFKPSKRLMKMRAPYMDNVYTHSIFGLFILKG
jgi:hypothetical protein